ncbi:hypothetical protein FH505_10680 [Bacillus velezensis]|uniref:UPF0489 family protein n=1 Tax=Bacillus velezensis TaxID=492670 RepID=UPI00111D16B0|nr:UPF0489 family protein [Bacillus velezensis]MBO3789594.1 UPF0489 family protein [Bacillus velezensis]MCX2885944.1 UPF0489 family protein [Bacillus velezensis]TNU64262.1 hypothetical protein FH505_10680 [Bacillus velezensis]
MTEEIIKEGYRISFPNKKIFIMRDHNFAFAAWEIGRLRGDIQPGASLIHIDAHLDYCDNPVNAKGIDSELKAKEVASQLDVSEFILPAQRIGTIKKCFTISDDSVHIEQNDTFQRAYSYNHYEQNLRHRWYKETEGTSVILDLDLDFFNKNFNDYNSNAVLLPEDSIITQLENIRDNMWVWDMITVALSPEYCGGERESDYLFELFLNVFGLNIEEAVSW